MVTKVNFTHTHFVSNVLKQYLYMTNKWEYNTLWIVDTRASNHMCNSLTILHDIQTLTPSIQVYMPNGTQLQANFSGKAKLSSSLVPTEVLYLQEQVQIVVCE